MKRAAAVSTLFCALLALGSAVPAGAAEIVTRNPRQIGLATDNQGRAMVSYTLRGRMWHVFYSGAVNARQPSQKVAQVKFKVDYSGGRGEWRHFKNTCRPYTGPELAWFVTACTASDGSYWALQAWQRMLPNVGYVPWKHEQKVWELHISHWTGELPQLEVYEDWVYGGKFHEVFGRATYRGQPIYGFKTTSSGKPLDTYGRLLFLDTFASAYGRGLEARELVRGAQPQRDVLLRLLSVLDLRELPAPALAEAVGERHEVPDDAVRAGSHAGRDVDGRWTE